MVRFNNNISEKEKKTVNCLESLEKRIEETKGDDEFFDYQLREDVCELIQIIKLHYLRAE